MLLHVLIMPEVLFSVLCMPHPVHGCNGCLAMFSFCILVQEFVLLDGAACGVAVLVPDWCGTGADMCHSQFAKFMRLLSPVTGWGALQTYLAMYYELIDFWVLH